MILLVGIIICIALFIGVRKLSRGDFSPSRYLVKKGFITIDDIPAFFEEYKGFIPREIMDRIQKSTLSGEEYFAIRESELLEIQRERDKHLNREKERRYRNGSLCIALAVSLFSGACSENRGGGGNP